MTRSARGSSFGVVLLCAVACAIAAAPACTADSSSGGAAAGGDDGSTGPGDDSDAGSGREASGDGATGGEAATDATNDVGAGATCTNASHVLPANASNPQDGITLGGYYVDTDTWNFASYPGSQQTMYVCDYDNWYAIDNVSDTSNDGAVKTYPDVHLDYSGQAVSSFTSISSTYAHTAPSSGAWDYAYDIWLNGYGTELMIWT